MEECKEPRKLKIILRHLNKKLNLRTNLNNLKYAMGTKIPADRIYHSDKVLAGVPQLLDDFHKLIDDQESGELLYKCDVIERWNLDFLKFRS